VHRYLEGILYENVNDVALRTTLIRSRGFCGSHAWGLVGVGDSLGTAIIYKDQVAQAIEDLQHASSGGRRGAGRRGASAGGRAALLRRRRAPQVPCPACRVGDEATARYLPALLQHIGEPEMKAAIERSPFLCLPDVVRAVEISESPDRSRAVLEIAAGKFLRLHGELAELIRKRDYRFAHEPTGEEQTSWSRAVGQLVGWRPRGRRE
jgi:Family of unknown function (DUF6062)